MPAFQNLVRARLMKRGGVGYAQPDHTSFPSVEEFHAMVEACQAIVCATWLDGLSAGEQSMEEELDILTTRGGCSECRTGPQLECRRPRFASPESAKALRDSQAGG